jgi:sugar lactone lactonase YvrE
MLAAAHPPRSVQAQVRVPDGWRVRQFAAGLFSIDGLTHDRQGRIYAAIEVTGSILRFDEQGKYTTVAAGMRAIEALHADQNGNIYTCEDLVNGRIVRVDIESGKLTILSQGVFSDMEGIAVHPQTGHLFVHAFKLDPATGLITASMNAQARRIRGQKNLGPAIVQLKAGQKLPADFHPGDHYVSPATDPPTKMITALTFSPDGILYFGTEGQFVGRVAPDGRPEVIAAGLGTPEGIHFDRQGNLYIAEESAGRISIATAAYLRSRKPGDPAPPPTADGPVRIFATGLGTIEDALPTPDGRVYVSQDGQNALLVIEPKPKS